MSDFSLFDHQMMARALKLARRGLRTTTPNPAVGCVIADGQQVIGEGWHEKAGGPHAEVHALVAAGDRAAGATAYVTLEPCSITGRTGACTAALIAAGIARVVYAQRDPNPAVDGAGEQALRAAGVSVQGGLLASSAIELNEGFARRMRDGRPFVTLKLAASLDGATAMASGESQWISGAAARADVQLLRARSCAILTGIGTVLADDPSLTVRDPRVGESPRQPLRVVVDSRFRTPPGANLIRSAGACLIVGTTPPPEALVQSGADCVRLAADQDGRPSLVELLALLAQRGINELMLECGATLAGAFAAAGLVDRYVFYLAPRLLGSSTQGLLETPGWLALADGVRLDIEDWRCVGDDLRLQARPA